MNKSNDLISRQAAIRIVDQFNREEMFHYMESLELDVRATQICHSAIEAVGTIKEQIEALPSAEPKTGKWIIRDNPGTGWYRVTCSECGEDVTSVIPMIGFFPNAKAIWNYCPDCGSYNGGEEE